VNACTLEWPHPQQPARIRLPFRPTCAVDRRKVSRPVCGSTAPPSIAQLGLCKREPKLDIGLCVLRLSPWSTAHEHRSACAADSNLASCIGEK
jgi:hypothetical protein